MASIYDRADIYDLIEDENRYVMYKEHWGEVIKGKRIHTLLDVSIGTGSVTIPLTDLGVSIYGSDLSEKMLEKCSDKMEGKKISPELKCADFRDLSCWGDAKFDMVASTGNSLAYVSNEDVLKALRQMDSHIHAGGFIYVDTRNWDKIITKRDRFYLYNPFFVADSRINLVQVWDYNADGTVTFNLLYTFEKDNKIYQKEHFEENYVPLSSKFIIDSLKELGYGNIQIMNFPAQYPIENVKDADWITIIAQKNL